MRKSFEELIRSALENSSPSSGRPVPFIENKRADGLQFQELLRLSEADRRWANFGPVSQLLESSLARYLDLPTDRTVVFCSSATAALFAMVAAKEYLAGRALRWVTSAYAFYSSWMGPLSGSLVVDCDAQGMLDLNELQALTPSSFDGLLVTNVFGTSPDLSKYIKFCRANKKHLIVDNAAVLDGVPRETFDSSVGEIISFHQTKPWGMGEGGCAIVSPEEATIVRAMTNFGVGLERRSAPGAGNSKISDFSCALILNRLRSIAHWRPKYREQAQRLYRIAKAQGLETLAPMDLSALTPPHLPLLCRQAIPWAGLAGADFAMQKYYVPHPGEYLRANNIYCRIVNVPCHPGMAELGDEEIAITLSRLVVPAPPAAISQSSQP